MTTAPTPEEFLAQTGGDDEDVDEISSHPDPLESIAASLRTIAAGLDRDVADSGDEQLRKDLGELEDEYRAIEALHDAKQGVIDQVLALCAKSTSKLADAIRAVAEPVVVPPAADDAPGDEG